MKAMLLILFASLLAGCQFDPYTSDYTTTKPLASNLVGVYVPTQKTQTYIQSMGNYPSVKMSITLFRDGTFNFNNIPDMWNTWGESFGKFKGKFDSGSGQWSMRKGQDWWSVMLDFTSTTGFNSEKMKGRFVTSIMLVGEKPPYLLHLTVGDPDSGDAMQFEKVGPS